MKTFNGFLIGIVLSINFYVRYYATNTDMQLTFNTAFIVIWFFLIIGFIIKEVKGEKP
jgi:hypothetical protein